MFIRCDDEPLRCVTGKCLVAVNVAQTPSFSLMVVLSGTRIVPSYPPSLCFQSAGSPRGISIHSCQPSPDQGLPYLDWLGVPLDRHRHHAVSPSDVRDYRHDAEDSPSRDGHRTDLGGVLPRLRKPSLSTPSPYKLSPHRLL